MNSIKKYFINFPDFFLNRNLETINDVENFITPPDIWKIDPFLFYSMDKAVDKILSNPKNKPIFIHGDCDADGVSSCALLYNYLKKIGFKVYYHIPNRSKEGHSISEKTIDYVSSIGSKLIITCDIGMSSHKEIKYANKLGIKTIITDHHKPLYSITDVVAIINPYLKQNSNMLFKEYCGSGVAFKLCHALNIRLKLDSDYLYKLMEIALIGIISDRVSMKNENRYLSYYGLSFFQAGSNKGIISLKKKTSPYINKIVRAINMNTKLHDSKLGVKLLTTNNPIQADRYADIITRNSRKNQRHFSNAINFAIQEVYLEDYKQNNGIFIFAKFDSAYNGSIAGNLSGQFNLPTIIISKMSDTNQYKGSCRSLGNIDILSFLESQKNILINLGGHSMAAGFIIKKDNIFKLKSAFFDYMNNKKIKIKSNRNKIDAIINLKDINFKMIDFFEKFMPYGRHNNLPIFLSKEVEIIENPSIFGRNKESIKFKVKQGKTILNAIGIGLINEFEKLITQNKLNIEYTVNRKKDNIILNVIKIK